MMKEILFQGDSITDAGLFRDYHDPFKRLGCGHPALIAARMDLDHPGEYEWINRGVNGDRIVGIYARMQRDLNNKPDNHDNWHGPWDGVKPVEDLSQVDEITSGRLYTECMMTVKKGLAELKEKGYQPVIRGLAWIQGETDGEIQFNNQKHQAAPVYAHNLSCLFAAFRKELSEISGQDLMHMPIVFGEINRFSRCICQAEAIVQAQIEVGRQPDNHLIMTEDLPIDPAIDEGHWNGNEEYFLGLRFGEKRMEKA